MVYSHPGFIDTYSPPALRSGGTLTVGAMKSWFEQPKIVPVRERIVNALTPAKYRFRRISPVVFICGGFESTRRDTLRKFFRKTYPNLDIFYAERVWELIASDPGLGALKMESDLAALSDMVIIIVESAGTFAELGAFSHVEDLRRKLLAIVDAKYQHDKSFVNTGPIHWIDAESRFSPTIWVKLDSILLCATEIAERVKKIPRPKSAAADDLASSRKLLLFFICDLVAIIAPATLETIQYFLGRMITTVDPTTLEILLLVGLAEAMGLLRKDEVIVGASGKEVFFSPAKTDTLQKPYHRIKWIDISGLRADFMSRLLCIKEASTVLSEVNSRR